MYRPCNTASRAAGFTLIELVVGIVVMSIALTYLGTVFFSSPARSVEPMLQIRASQFAQSLLDEMMAKRYDENTPLGGVPACTACTPAAALGPEPGESRASYDDVDDYDSYCSPAAPVALADVFGAVPPNTDSFAMSICVDYDGDYDGVADSNTAAKLISIALFPPVGEAIVFRAYRSNF